MSGCAVQNVARRGTNSSLAKNGGSMHAQALAPIAARELRQASVERIEQRRHFIVQRVARGGQLQCARLALEEAHAERLLELLHLVTDCGWRQEQLIRSDLEAAVTGSDAERPQVPQRRAAGTGAWNSSVDAKSMHAFCKFHACAQQARDAVHERSRAYGTGERAYRSRYAAPEAVAVSARARITSTRAMRSQPVLRALSDCSESSSQRASEPKSRRARAPRDLLAIAKQDQRGDAADAETPRELLMLVGVELADLQLRASLIGDAIEHRRHRAAGAAPRRPEVHEHRQAAACGVRLERLRIERHRAAGAPRATCSARRWGRRPADPRARGPACGIRGRQPGRNPTSWRRRA